MVGAARGADQALGLDMVVPHFGGVGRIIDADEAGIDDMAHPGRHRRIDRRLVLHHAGAHPRAGNQQQHVSPAIAAGSVAG
jgi:hypothetical protein